MNNQISCGQILYKNFYLQLKTNQNKLHYKRQDRINYIKKLKIHLKLRLYDVAVILSYCKFSLNFSHSIERTETILLQEVILQLLNDIRIGVGNIPVFLLDVFCSTASDTSCFRERRFMSKLFLPISIFPSLSMTFVIITGN